MADDGWKIIHVGCFPRFIAAVQAFPAISCTPKFDLSHQHPGKNSMFDSLIGFDCSKLPYS